MMKRITAILLAALMCAACMASFAGAEVYITPEDSEIMTDSIQSICAVGDTLWIAARNLVHLYAHKAGETEPVAYQMPNASLTDEDMADKLSVTPWLFTDGERLLLLEITADYTWTDPEFRAQMNEVVLLGDEVTLELICDVDISMFVDSDFIYEFSSTASLANCGLVTCYANDGRKNLYRIDYETGAVRIVDIDNPETVCAWQDGKALVQSWNYDGEARMYSYDPANEMIESVSTISTADAFAGIAWCEGSQSFYCARRGEIVPLDVYTGEVGEPVSDMPADVQTYNPSAIINDEWYAGADYSGYAIRSLVSSDYDKEKLRVNDYTWVEAVNLAAKEFNKSYPDSIAIVNHGQPPQKLIDAMLNQDSSVDVYVMSCSDSDFEAVRTRGYMADLSASDKLSAMFDRMSEEGKDLCMTSNGFSMLPVMAYFRPVTFHGKALEAMSMTIDDVPNDWLGLLEWMHSLEGNLPMDVTLVDPFYTAQEIRSLLFQKIFGNYQLLLSEDPDAASSQDMLQILHALDAIDFERLGARRETDSDDMFAYEYDEDRILMNTMNYSALAKLTYTDEPRFPSLTAQTPEYIVADTYVAFINPYTAHMDKALAFMEALAGNLEDDIVYTLCEDMNEPTLNPYHDEMMQQMQDELEALRAKRETADAFDAQEIDDQISLYEQSIADAENDIYDISEKDIAWVRSHEGKIVMDHYPWLYREESGDASEMVNQYVEGNLSADALMNEIDRKIRMMIMEGM